MKYKADKRISRVISTVLTAVILIAALYIIADYVMKDQSTQTVSYSESDDFVRIIDVGQGDSILISSNGKNCLIDTGDFGTDDDLCRRLKGYGIKRLDVLAITHFHDDHSGGSEAVTEDFEIDNLIYPNFKKTQSYSDNERIARQNVLAEDGDFRIAKKGMNFTIGDFNIEIIGYYPELENENSKSVVFMAKIRGRKFLITGDAETDTESKMLKDGVDVSCDVLKVGHHGSSTSTSKKFLTAASPAFAAISCGKGNKYSHPHDETLAKLEKEKIKIFRTDISGDITFLVSESGTINVNTEK